MKRPYTKQQQSLEGYSVWQLDRDLVVFRVHRAGLQSLWACGPNTLRSNQSVTFEELLAATGVVWARRPAREATVCFKTTTAAARDVSSAAASSAGIRAGEFSSGWRDGSGGSRPV